MHGVRKTATFLPRCRRCGTETGTEPSTFCDIRATVWTPAGYHSACNTPTTTFDMSLKFNTFIPRIYTDLYRFLLLPTGLSCDKTHSIRVRTKTVVQQTNQSCECENYGHDRRSLIQQAALLTTAVSDSRHWNLIYIILISFIFFEFLFVLYRAMYMYYPCSRLSLSW